MMPALLLALCLAAAPDPAGTALAWARFDEAAKDYAGLHYRWLGDGALKLSADVAPAAGRSLALLWGAKSEQRAATLTINGRELPLRAGGYDGFRWLVVPLPAGLTGERCLLELQPVPGAPAAFVAEVRLLDPTPPAAPQDLSARAYRLTVEQTSRRADAFADRRAQWDRPAPAELTETQAAAWRRGGLAAEAWFRCRRYIDGWAAHCDPATGLVPRNLGASRTEWWPRDSGADNYPFMVLTAAMTDKPLLDGRLLDLLRTETKLTSRLDRIPDQWSFAKRDFVHPRANLDRMVFDGAEYVKDGLLYIAEWLGPCPWTERMTGIIDDIWRHAPIETPAGKLPTLNFEVNGDLLQACSRLYWFTGDRKYLDWAIRLGDYYLLGTHHPTRDGTMLSLGDHSCEVINGLSELYVACRTAAPEKYAQYRAPLHELYDRLLAIARDERGLIYLQVNTRTGAHGARLTDNWGYNYDGLYTAWLLDGTIEYRDAVRRVLSNLPSFAGYFRDMDSLADSVEGALTLYNREPVPAALDYIDREMRSMWSLQHPDGVIEGWHGDGNFARTSLMYALWQTQGLTVEPWRADLRLGAVREGDRLTFVLASDAPWSGKLIFDRPRHRLNMHLPLDYPRINQFPEWFTVEPDRRYRLGARELDGRELLDGLALEKVSGTFIDTVAPAR